MTERGVRDASIRVLVLLAALMIRIFAVADGSTLIVGAVGAASLIVVVSIVGRGLMDHRHERRLDEIEAERRVIVEATGAE